MSEIVLRVNDLKTYFYTQDGIVKAVDGISFTLMHGETLGIVGESGSGKSVTALSILRLISDPPGRIINGKIYLNGKDIFAIEEKRMQQIRGNEIAMIFQDPMTSLNPVFTIGNQIIETIMLHQKQNKTKARERTIDLLKDVGIPNPEQRINEYPHQFSGGMRQRAMIAMALSCNPKILIADEPTTALDVTIQAQILSLLNKIKENTGLSMIIITHDLGVIAEMADNIIIMYSGRVVEYSDVHTIFYNSLHPYTWGLLRSIPRLDEIKRERLIPIPGLPPSLIDIPSGCPFSPRCQYAKKVCFKTIPELRELRRFHRVACHLSDDEVQKYKKERIFEKSCER